MNAATGRLGRGANARKDAKDEAGKREEGKAKPGTGENAIKSGGPKALPRIPAIVKRRATRRKARMPSMQPRVIQTPSGTRGTKQ
jgi:hypothetical protein